MYTYLYFEMSNVKDYIMAIRVWMKECNLHHDQNIFKKFLFNLEKKAKKTQLDWAVSIAIAKA